MDLTAYFRDWEDQGRTGLREDWMAVMQIMSSLSLSSLSLLILVDCLALSNCGTAEDSREFLGLQGDQISQS